MWALVGPWLEDPPRRFRHPGRSRYSPRQCLDGVLYVLFTGTPWSELPYRELGLPSGETCRRRLEEWQQRGVFEQVLVALQDKLAEQERLSWSRVIVDASLIDAKKGAKRSRVPSAASPERRSISS
jgi:transposase